MSTSFENELINIADIGLYRVKCHSVKKLMLPLPKEKIKCIESILPELF